MSNPTQRPSQQPRRNRRSRSLADGGRIARKTNYILVTESNGEATLRWIRPDLRNGGQPFHMGKKIPPERLWADPARAESRYITMGWKVKWEI